MSNKTKQRLFEMMNKVGGMPLSENRKQEKKLIYFDSFSNAVGYAREHTENMGFEINEDDWFSNVTTAYPGRPDEGKTFRASGIGLTKGGNEQKATLHIQVYNRGGTGDIYELNFYVS